MDDYAAKEPDDYVLATGKTYTVRNFVELAFNEVGIEIEWSGEGVNEIGVDKKDGVRRVAINPKYFRPTEVDLLLGDASKAKVNWLEARDVLERTCQYNGSI